jgi:hypothetical protein
MVHNEVLHATYFKVTKHLTVKVKCEEETNKMLWLRIQ